MKNEAKMFQRKKPPETDPIEKFYYLPDKGFKTTTPVNMLTETKRTIYERSKNSSTQASETAPWVKALVVKLIDPSSIPRTYIGRKTLTPATVL